MPKACAYPTCFACMQVDPMPYKSKMRTLRLGMGYKSKICMAWGKASIKASRACKPCKQSKGILRKPCKAKHVVCKRFVTMPYLILALASYYVQPCNHATHTTCYTCLYKSSICFLLRKTMAYKFVLYPRGIYYVKDLSGMV